MSKSDGFSDFYIKTYRKSNDLMLGVMGGRKKHFDDKKENRMVHYGNGYMGETGGIQKRNSTISIIKITTKIKGEK